MKTDQKVAQPAPSPQAGEIVFPAEQAGLEERAARRVEGKEIGMLLPRVLHRVFPAGSALRPHSGQHGHLCLRPPEADPLFWPHRQVTEERPRLQLSTPSLFSADSGALCCRES